MFIRKTEYPLVFISGGIIYMLIEIMWRGYTHWSMGICAGVCFIGIYSIEKYRSDLNIIIKCVIGSAFITLNEFITGCIVNIIMKWNVWDYSNTHFNVLGQICLLFSFFWFLLCFPAFKISKIINEIFSNRINAYKNTIEHNQF